VIVAAGLVLLAADRGQRESSRLKFATGESGMRIARFLFGFALIPIGLSHFVYAPQTIGFVPTWLPFRPAWAYLGGAGHIAAGLGVLFGVVPRLAAMLEAGMIGVFTALVWVPLVIRTPASQLQWTGVVISWTIAAAAWVVAGSLTSTRPSSTNRGAAHDDSPVGVPADAGISSSAIGSTVTPGRTGSLSISPPSLSSGDRQRQDS
jgi:uncharacterized membrane protein